jgi:pimeloyl-ACP methyl ester carboxylesterase
MAKKASKAKSTRIGRYGHFFVGGKYHRMPDGERIMAGHIYVESFTPVRVTQPLPIIMVHGGGQTGTNFTCTPDGREGWAQYFVGKGYQVYVVDEPGRGRSVYEPEVYGPSDRHSAEDLSRRFARPELHNDYPTAHLHNQWPGKGTPGDPVFDNFYSTQMRSIHDRVIVQQFYRDAGVAALDAIGPVILLTHSQSGAIGWAIADARPKLVKTIVAVEPGPAVMEITCQGKPDYAFTYKHAHRDWGVSGMELAYTPKPAGIKDMRFVQEDKPQGPGLARVYRQVEPARKLVNFKGIPVLVVTGEASFHAPYDHGTAQFLVQAGVDCTHIRLEDAGVHGNGHMMMLEKNNRDIAAVIDGWLCKTLRQKLRKKPKKTKR